MAPSTDDTSTSTSTAGLVEDMGKLALDPTSTGETTTNAVQDTEEEKVVFTGRIRMGRSTERSAPTAAPTATDQRYIPPRQRAKASGSHKSKHTMPTDQSSSMRLQARPTTTTDKPSSMRPQGKPTTTTDKSSSTRLQDNLTTTTGKPSKPNSTRILSHGTLHTSPISSIATIIHLR